MNMFNFVLTVLFAAGALYMGKIVLNQRKQIKIACKYINAYRLFIMLCFLASVVILFMKFEDVLDLIRSILMTVMVGLFLCIQEGIGDEGLICNGTLIPYAAVSHYDYKKTDKELEVYVVFREKVKDKTEESNFTLKFKSLNSQDVLNLLERNLPKKYKRIKKS